jgi:hypothetical protein
MFLGSAALAQQIEIGPGSAAGSGWTPWYEVRIDPEDSSKLVLCGSKWDAGDNASYGFVYFSSDGGTTWRTVLEDRNTTWVTEQSCAFGAHGVVYYVSDASKIIGDELHHELGTTRIYVSHDSGKTWNLGITTGWTDYSTSVIDTMPGPNQNRLYVFFNNLQTFYTSLGRSAEADAEKKENSGTRIGMINWKEGEAEVTGPFSNTEMFRERYRGSYPAPSFLLKDGSIVVFYTSKRRNKDNLREFLAEMARVDPARTGLERPMHIAISVERGDEKPNVECGGLYLGSAAAYDSERHKLYYVYPDVRDTRCMLFIASSTDGGHAWSKPRPMQSPDDSDGRQYTDVAIEVNKDGVLGVMWQEKSRSGCWRFAISTDGQSLSRSKELDGCTAESSKPTGLSTSYLWSSFFQADTKEKPSTARINLRNTRGSVWRNERTLVTMADGSFRAAWIDTGSEIGGVKTASIRVIPPDKMISAETNNLKDVTNSVAILYGGSQSYDAKTGILTLEAVIRNTSEKELKNPLKLAVSQLYKDYGRSEIANADNKATGAGAVWDVSHSIPNGTLAPGSASKPFSLRFRYIAEPTLVRDSDDILGLNIKVFAAE